MKNFTKMKSWLLLMVMSMLLTAPAAFADGYEPGNPKGASLEITDLDIGFWAVDAWQENAKLVLTNTGTVDITVNDGDLEDPDKAFTLHDVTFPFTIAKGATKVFDVSFSGDVSGSFDAKIGVIWDAKGLTTGGLHVDAYDANVGDVFETPIDVIFASGIYTGAITIADFKSNYKTPAAASAKDVVYKFTVAEDKKLDVSSTNADVEFTLYAEDFNLQQGPMADNALESFGNAVNDYPLFNGTYYIVASCDTDFDVDIAVGTMPIPAIAYDPIPTNGELEVPANLSKVEWKVGEFAEEYRLFYGTNYPASVLVQDWTAVATEYTLANELQPNTTYHWRVELRNNDGAPAIADEWGFTTSISVPQNVVAVVADTNDVTLTWTALGSKGIFKGYNVFRDGVKLNATLLTVNTYTDMDLAFNMAPGYTYNVTAEYEEGESVYSTDVVVMIDGIGFVNGTVYQLLAPGNPIAGATVTLTNVDGGDNYTFTTDATGMYEGEVYQGTYDYVCAADGYISVSANGVPVGYNLTVSYPFLLDEFPYPVTSVTATEQDENNVLVEWVFNSKEVVEFNIYRSMCDGSDRTLLGSVISGSQFLDQTWGAVTGFGTYKWEVEVQYTNNAASAFSDPCLDKNMEAVVDVKVTTNTVNAPGPEGTFVAFVNTDDVAYNFEVTLDATGMDQIPAVRKGNYDYTVTLDGFAVISGNVDILQDELFEWELMELTNPGFDLYVTPTGYATWIDPNAVEDVTYLSESFDTEIPADWTITDGGDSEDTWYWTPDGTPCASYCMGTLNGTPYLKVDSDAAGSGNHLIETITTAAVDASGAVELFLEFDHFFYKYYGSTGDVDVWDGAAWVNVAHITKGGSWSTPQHKNIDVLAYANADFKVRFTYDDNGSWGYYWAVDDIKISGKAVVSSKEFLSYRVWLDGNFSADTDQAKYQYGDNAEVLVAGQTYFSEVANEYTSGFSAKINYTFTYQPCTAFDGTANLAAVYQGGTADVLVSWDAVADQTIDGVTYEAMGTNVYRDGMMLSFVAAGTTTLLDASLAPATYEYCTEVVYSLDAGAHTWESCAINCVSDVVVPADIFGDVAGFVYDAIDNSPIASASIMLADGTNSYTLNTDATGAYTSNAVIAGTYEYTVTAAGYVEQTKADVVVAFGTTATEDFYMIETAYPVGNVHATEIDDNTVKVTWGEVPAEGWLARDDGNMVFGGIGGPPGEPITFQTAVKFTPDMLEDYLNSGFITSISLAQIANIPTVSELRIYQGAGMDDLIYTQDILADFAYDNSTEVVTLDDAVAFDATQNLWISIYSEQPADGFNAPLSFATDFVSGTSDIYAMNGVWTSVEESFGLGGYAFMLRAYATTDAGSKSVALGTVEIPEGKYKDYSAFGSTSTGLKGKVESDKVYTVATMNSKSLLGFNIYRLPCTVDAVASEYFIGYTLDAAQFTDNSWGTVDWGMYKWAVEAVYTNDNLAPAAFSVECLDKEMETLVNMTVTTNSGDSPGGTSVTFKNTIETGLDDITTTIPGSGMKTIDPFRKGTYDISVVKAGFAPIDVAGVVIHDETDFVWELIEAMIAPMDLYVTPTGYATWTLGGAEFVPVSEDFEGGSLPDDWEITTNSAIGWFFTTDGSSAYVTIPAGDGTYACASDDAANDDSSVDYLIMPEMDFSGLAMGELAFSAWSNNAYGQVNTVEISINGEAWEVIKTIDASDSWQTVTVDLTDYAGETSVKLAFHGNDGGSWASAFAVDNVTVGEASSKSVLDFMVYHEGNFIKSTVEQFYQYGETGEVLVPGTTYVAEVAAVYTTGMSPKAAYTWTYMSCSELSDWNAIVGQNVAETNDVLVQWTDFEIPNTVLYFNNFDAYTSSDYLAVVDPENWTTWSNAPGSAEDAVISDAFSASAPNAVMVSGTNDAVFPMGDKTTGTYELDFDMYVPAGKTGYFNIQHVTLSEWTMSLTFMDDLSITVSAGGQAPTGLTYAADTWFNVHVLMNIDGDVASVEIDGTEIVEWQFSLQENGDAGVAQLGCANMYAYDGGNGGTPEYYFDNFSFEQHPTGGGGGGTGDEFFEDFEAGTTPTGWLTLDEDGDSYIWQNTAVDDFGFDAYSGDYCMTSASYINDVGALTPDNWLISPAIAIGSSSELSFMIDAQDAGYSDEQYYVLVSTTGTNVSDFTQIHSAVSLGDWAEVVLDLSAYAGETVHIAFRHADVTDMFYLKMDDFKVSNSDTKAAFTPTVAHTASNGMPFRTSGMDASQIEAAFAAYTTNNAKGELVVVGSNLYRDGEMLAFIATPDTFYVDMDMEPGLYDYCVEKVYSDDAGVHTFTCGTQICVDDVLVAEECVTPENLIAEDLLGDGYTATLSWGGVQADMEFRHDDGTSLGQLGAGSGTMNTVLGNLHTSDAVLNQMSWYLTSEGSQTNITLYVMGLDANGFPDGSNVLFATEVSTTTDEWNTYTFANPIVVDGGFFLGLASNGFLAIGTDDGVGDPYVFQTGTHFFTMDYTSGGWETWETYDFSFNGMVRAMGVEGAVNSYDYVAPTSERASDFEYIKSNEPTVTDRVGTKGFTGYNVYRGDDMIASGIQEETYADNVGYAGNQCYTVTASFEYCEESAHSNEACVNVGVGVDNLDNDISIYPNPATDYVMVEASSTIRSIKVTNYMGQVVNSIVTVDNTQQRIETSSLSAGVYFVEVETEAGIETVRIVISK